ncbi:DUF317 domain-containing protein [Streptomyces cyaneofuscatus]|uniref:DUF317 domain-containing protein n=1 Tax=Streptomyces cyaneofuscatus TaxID=66883 RepID=UPI003693D02E
MPTELVLVSPRHLAGPGTASTIADALGPLIHHFGWTTVEKLPHGRRVLLASPGGEILVDFDPLRQDGVWWTISHHEPHWRAEFSRQTPAEAITAVTQALPQMLGDDRYADRIPVTDQTTASLAREGGWSVRGTRQGATWTSPDGHCTAEHTAGTEHVWHIKHSVLDGFDTHWSAAFTVDTPERVTAQFMAHLTDDRPVLRHFEDVPALARGAAVITPLSIGGLGAHTVHAVDQVGRAVPKGRSPSHR